MTAASTKTRLSVMLATDALVTALDAEGWRTLNPRTQPTNNQKLAPTAPLTVNGSAVRQGNNERVTLLWTNSVGNNQSGFEIQGATDSGFANIVYNGSVGANVTTITTGNLPRVDYFFRVRAVNPVGSSAWVNAAPFPIPLAP